MYWDAINLYGQTLSEKLPVNSFECIKTKFTFDEDFMMKKVTQDIFLKYPKQAHALYNYLIFLPERMSIETVCIIKKNMLYT